MTATLPGWMVDTGPIHLAVPDGDDFWRDQPRDRAGRWAPKEKPLPYRHLVPDEPAPPPVRREANGVVLVSTDAGVAHHRCRVVRDDAGRFRVIYDDDPDFHTTPAPTSRRPSRAR